MTLDQLVDIVAMPLLLQDEVLRPVDVGVYTNLRHLGATTSYALARRVRLSREALRQSLLRLKQSGWVIESSSTPYGGVVVHAWMPVEVERQLADELERVSRDVKYLGECLLRWALDLLIEDREYQDNVRPTWLVSGTGSQAFEVDRMLPRHRVAIEISGTLSPPRPGHDAGRGKPGPGADRPRQHQSRTAEQGGSAVGRVFGTRLEFRADCGKVGWRGAGADELPGHAATAASRAKAVRNDAELPQLRRQRGSAASHGGHGIILERRTVARRRPVPFASLVVGAAPAPASTAQPSRLYQATTP